MKTTFVVSFSLSSLSQVLMKRRRDIWKKMGAERGILILYFLLSSSYASSTDFKVTTVLLSLAGLLLLAQEKDL